MIKRVLVGIEDFINYTASKNLHSALLFTLFLFFWSYYTVPWHFGKNDDLGFIFIARGALSGTHSDNLIHMSTLIGKILVWFYKHFPETSWYPVFMYILIFTAVFWIHFHTFKYLRGNPLLTILIFLISILHFTFLISNPTYTMVSFLLALAAFVSLSSYPSGSKETKPFLLSGVWLGLAFLVREEGFQGALLIGFAFWIIAIRKNPGRFLVFAAGAGVVICLGMISDHFSYSPKEWKDFFKFNETRIHLHDYSVSNDAVPEILKKNDWSINDLESFRQLWWFLNEKKYSLEKLENALAINSKYKPSLLKTISRDLPDHIKGLAWLYKPYISAGLILFSILCLLSLKRWEKLCLQAGLLLTFICVSVYLKAYMKFPERVAIPVFLFYCFSAVSLYLYLEAGQTEPVSRWRKYLIFVLILSAVVSIAPQVGRSNHTINQRVKASFAHFNASIPAIKRLPPDSTLIMHWFPYDAFPLFSDIKFSGPSNIIIMGWPVRSPLFYERLKRIGVSTGQEFENMLLKSSNIYMFGSEKYFKILQQYMKENYGVNDLERDFSWSSDIQNKDLFKIIRLSASVNDGV